MRPTEPFDPFGDFETRGYLRNTGALKDPAKIKLLEHLTFLANVDRAFHYLHGREHLDYADVLKAHEILFLDFYPWSGQDRLATAPEKAVRKGKVEFEHPLGIRRAAEYGLKQGQDLAFMASNPGVVLGTLSFAHPFLEGNGRAILTVHTVLAERSGISIDWPSCSKSEFLSELTREIESPGRGHLDRYLSSKIRPPLGLERLSGHLSKIEGLDA